MRKGYFIGHMKYLSFTHRHSYLGAAIASILLALTTIGFAPGLLGILPLAYFIKLNVASTNKIHSFKLGFLFGIGYFLICYWPVSTAGNWTGWALVSNDANTSINTGAGSKGEAALSIDAFLIITLIVMSVCSAVLSAIVCLFSKFVLMRKGRTCFYIAFVVAWLLVAESVRSWVLLDGYHFINLGRALVDFPIIRLNASLGGINLLSGIFIILSVVLVEIWLVRAINKTVITLSALLILSFSYGSIHHLNLEKEEGILVPVSAVQTSIAQSFGDTAVRKDFNAHWLSKRYLNSLKAELNYQKSSQLTQIIALPESIGFGTMSIDGSLSKRSSIRTLSDIAQWDASIVPLFSEQQTIVVLGSDTTEKQQDFNSLVVWDSHGRVSRYHKRKLVPFAEYTPNFIKSLSAFEERIGYSRGSGHQVRSFNAFKLAFLICQETLFPNLVRDTITEGKANLIIVSGNDGVFESKSVSYINHQNAQIRAIENGRAVVRAMKNGISSIILANGKVLDKVAVNKEGTARGMVKMRNHTTLYARYPYLTELFALLVFISLVALCLVRRQQSI